MAVQSHLQIFAFLVHLISAIFKQSTASILQMSQVRQLEQKAYEAEIALEEQQEASRASREAWQMENQEGPANLASQLLSLSLQVKVWPLQVAPDGHCLICLRMDWSPYSARSENGLGLRRSM